MVTFLCDFLWSLQEQRKAPAAGSALCETASFARAIYSEAFFDRLDQDY
jgi:hypothetical protein